jgi:hypothetical protein
VHVRSIVAIAAALSVSACAGTTSAPLEVSPGQTVQLRVGETASVTPGSVRVQLANLNESRCPSDVVCIQAGDAMSILTFNGAGAQRTDTLYLSRQPRNVSYGGYRFEAVDVQPYPRSSGQQPTKTLSLRVTGPE